MFTHKACPNCCKTSKFPPIAIWRWCPFTHSKVYSQTNVLLISQWDCTVHHCWPTETFALLIIMFSHIIVRNKSLKKLWNEGLNMAKKTGVKMSGMSLSGSEWVDWVSLSGSEWVDWVSLSGSELVDWVSLSGSELVDWVSLSGSEWVDWVSLSGSELVDWVSLSRSELVDWVSLSGSELVDWVSLSGSELVDWMWSLFWMTKLWLPGDSHLPVKTHSLTNIQNHQRIKRSQSGR